MAFCNIRQFARVHVCALCVACGGSVDWLVVAFGGGGGVGRVSKFENVVPFFN